MRIILCLLSFTSSVERRSYEQIPTHRTSPNYHYNPPLYHHYRRLRAHLVIHTLRVRGPWTNTVDEIYVLPDSRHGDNNWRGYCRRYLHGPCRLHYGMHCATLLAMSTSVDYCSNCRSGVVGQCGDGDGGSFSFRCFLLFLRLVRGPPDPLACRRIYPSYHVVLKIIAMSRNYTPPDGYVLGYVLYSSFTLASTLWCTLLIIYRIVTVARSAGEAGAGLSAYRPVIEVLVESSALYSISLILFVAFYARNDATMYYFDVLSAITRVHSHSFHIVAFHRHFPGNRPDTPRRTRRSWSRSPGRLLAGKHRVLASLRNTSRRSELSAGYYYDLG